MCVMLIYKFFNVFYQRGGYLLIPINTIFPRNSAVHYAPGEFLDITVGLWIAIICFIKCTNNKTS